MGAPLALSFMVGVSLVVVVLVAAVFLVGVFWPGTGAEQVDWHPARSPEAAMADDVEDVQQMLSAANVRRRRRGLPDLTEDDLAGRVARDQREAQARRDRAAGAYDD